MSLLQKRYKDRKSETASGLYTEVYIFDLTEDQEYRDAREAFQYAGYKTTELFVNNQLAFEISLNRIEV